MFPLKDDIPTRRFPILTVLIIVACTVVYFGVERGGLTLGETGDKVAIEYGATPCEFPVPDNECDRTGAQRPDAEPEEWWITVFTSMFLHGGLLHLAGNMLFLWIFGNNVEDSMGRARFVAFYLLGGIAAVAAQTAIDPSSTAPTIGASGAIAAVLGGYALLYPRARVITLVFIVIFFTILELPALLVLGLWFLLQLLPAFADPIQDGGGGIAYFAHIGGFVFGLVAIKLFANRVHDDYERHHRVPVY